PELDYIIEGIKDAADHTYQTAKGLGSMLIKKANKVFETASELAKGSTSEKTDDDSANEVGDEAQAQDNKPSEDDSFTLSLEALIQLAPFMSREKVSKILLDYDTEVPPSTLIKLAPFITPEALNKMLSAINRDNMTADVIIAFAPFLRQDILFKLMLTNLDKLDLAAIKKLAPYLKKGMVDVLVDTICGVQKTVNLNTLSDIADKTVKGVGSLFGKIMDAIGAKPVSSEPSEEEAEPEDDGTEGSEAQDVEEADYTADAHEDVEEETEASDAEQSQPGSACDAAEAPAQNDTSDQSHADETAEKDKLARAALENKSWIWLRQNLNHISDDKLLTEIALTAANELTSEDARDMLLNAVPYMSVGAFEGLVNGLCERGLWDRTNDLSPFADAANAGEILTRAASGGKDALDTVRLYAAKAPRDVWESEMKNAVSTSNWELVNALTEMPRSDK
ncbi:MAG: hypothetical protein II920_04050, partial [Clostridia bacterium]|nr:hypothetical protein [Clostridia bacterium]